METDCTCFNPRIIKRYDDNVWCEEGMFIISRWSKDYKCSRDQIKFVVKYEDEDKKDHKIKLSGMAARVFST